MGSATSSSKFRGWFNLTLFQKNITRFWPIWAVYTAVLAFLLPVELLLTLTSRSNLFANAANLEDVRNIVRFATASMPAVGLVFGAMAAIALFSYLMNSRSVQLLHSLPIRREGLFLTNWLSGLAFFLAPNLALFLVSVLIEAGMGLLRLDGLLMWLVTATVCPMFFFCFAVCVAMFTGHILALPVFYGILNALVIGVCALMDFAGGLLLYNYNGNNLVDSDPARWCTPVYQLYHLLDPGNGINAQAVTAVAGYCVVLGAAFTLIAVLVYQRRQLERAGDIITVGWVRPVFQYGLGVCIGLLLGLVLYTNFFRSFGCGAYIFLTALCAVIGAFAGRMLLKKTLRVFAEGWKGCFALGIVMALALFGVRADLLGFQRWVPDPAQVVSVQIHGPYTAPDDDGRHLDQTFTEAADIQRLVELHKALNADMETLRAFKERRAGSYEGWDESGQYQIMDTQYLRLSYTMADGSVVDRWYDPIPIRGEELEEPDTYAGMLNALLNDPAVVERAYWYYLYPEDNRDVGEAKATGGWITRAAEAGKYGEDMATDGSPAAASWDAVYTENNDLTLTDRAAQRLWEAFREDLSAGRVRRYLLNDKARQENCYVSDINLSLSWMAVTEEGDRYTQGRDFTFTPQKSQTSVMAALEKLGLKEALQERVFEYDYEPPVG